MFNMVVQIVAVKEQASTHFYGGNHALVCPAVESAFLDTQVLRRFLYAEQSFIHLVPVWLAAPVAV